MGAVFIKGVITNKAYRELTGAIDRTALRDLNDLCTKGIFLKRDKKAGLQNMSW
jgi:hypothetical protein